MSDLVTLLRQRVRELELEAVAVRARYQEAIELLAIAERGARRSQRKIQVINLPQRRASTTEPETAA